MSGLFFACFSLGAISYSPSISLIILMA
jgi:hypothetical protein